MNEYNGYTTVYDNACIRDTNNIQIDMTLAKYTNRIKP